MLRSLLSAIFLIFCQVAFSQNHIVMKNSSRINVDSIYAITPPIVQYVTLGSIHDLAISTIEYIIQGDYRITFDENQNPVYTLRVQKPVVVQKDTLPATVPVRVEPKPVKTKAQKIVRKTEKVESEKDLGTEVRSPSLAVLFYPLSLLELDGGLRAGVEVPLTENSSVLADANYLFRGIEDFTISGGFSGEDFWGFAGRLEYRNYFPNKNNPKMQMYAGPQLMFKYKSWTVPDNLFFNGGERTHSIFSANFKFGFVSTVGERFFFDMYTGLGIRYKIATNGSTFIPPVTQGLPNFLLGMALGLKLGGL